MESGVCQYFILHLPDQTGTATSSPADKTSSPIFTVCWELKRNGYAESTIEATGKRLIIFTAISKEEFS